MSLSVGHILGVPNPPPDSEVTAVTHNLFIVRRIMNKTTDPPTYVIITVYAILVFKCRHQTDRSVVLLIESELVSVPISSCNVGLALFVSSTQQC